MQVVVKTEEAAAELSVSEVTRRVRARLEGDTALRGLWIRGEISNVRLGASGHLYFTLKDDASQLRACYWNFARGGRKAPEEGKATLVHGDIRVYEQRGEYQLVCDDLIKVGEGDLAARFEELRRKLHAEGLFEDERKIPLPLTPACIAVVTSASTAALQDVINVLTRRAPYCRVVLFHASVQGNGAPAEIVAALQSADGCAEVETILLVRGGGSAEDLACFNDEALCRALADVRKPVICGVGHEIDTTIVDFIADRRAPTPSAAAELAAADSTELCAAMQKLTQRIGRTIAGRIDARRDELRRLFDRRVLRDIAGSVLGRAQQLDELAGRLVIAGVARTHGVGPRGEAQKQWYEQLLTRASVAVERKLSMQLQQFEQLRDDLQREARERLEQLSARLRDSELRINALDPRAPLKAGFALVWDSAGQLVRDPAAVAADAELRVDVQQGSMQVRREG